MSGGGLSSDGTRWIAARPYYFLPVRVLSRVFRNLYCRLLQQAYARGEVEFHGRLAALAEPQAFRCWLAPLARREWVVYAKRPFRQTSCVLKYLARYTHRVAISNHRLLKYEQGRVTFRYKDYAQQGRSRSMTLAATEFIRRFLLHVLPTGLMRIRHYGYLANRHRRQKLELCRQLLGAMPPAEPPVPPASDPHVAEEEAADPCPACQTGRLRIVLRWDRGESARYHPPPPRRRALPLPREDSS